MKIELSAENYDDLDSIIVDRGGNLADLANACLRSYLNAHRSEIPDLSAKGAQRLRLMLRMEQARRENATVLRCEVGNVHGWRVA